MSKSSTKSAVSDSIGTVSASLDDALEVIGKRGRKAKKSAKKSAKSAHKSVKNQYAKESNKVVSLASRRKPKHSAAKKTVLGVLLAGGLAAAIAKVLKK